MPLFFIFYSNAYSVYCNPTVHGLVYIPSIYFEFLEMWCSYVFKVTEMCNNINSLEISKNSDFFEGVMFDNFKLFK